MNHDILKEVIFDQHEIIKKTKIVPRDYDFDLNANYVLIGLRRAGKSTLLYKIVKDLVEKGIEWNQIIYINFEDERLAEFSLNDFNDLLSVQAELTDKIGYFFLDEIQNIEGWEKFARRMADSKEHTFITGSNAKMLSQEIENRLGGRYFTKYITPYNFKEFLTAKQIDFEGCTFKAPGRPDEYLQSIYGEWRKLPPPEKRVVHSLFFVPNLIEPKELLPKSKSAGKGSG